MMENTDIKTFMEMAEQRADIAAKIEEIGYDNLDGLASYASTLGLTVTAEKLAQLRDSMLTNNRELDDAELDAVAGGFLFRPRPSVYTAAPGPADNA